MKYKIVSSKLSVKESLEYYKMVFDVPYVTQFVTSSINVFAAAIWIR